MILQKNNKYDYLLIIFIASIACGDIGGSLQPIRALTILMFPFAVVYFANNAKSYAKYSGVIAFCLLWIAYSAITIFWSHAPSLSLQKWIYLFVHCCGMLVLFYLFEKSNNKAVAICLGWIVMFLITAPIALYELFTDIHLSYSKTDSALHSLDSTGNYMLRNFASVTFFNLNSYNTVVCYALPFITVQLLYPIKNKNTYKLSIYFTFAAAAFIIVSNSSRASLLVLIACVAFYIFKTFKRGIIQTFVVCAALMALFYYLWEHGFFDVILGRFIINGLESEGRSTLILNLLDATLNSAFMGVGIGNIDYVMATDYNMGLTAPHNLYLEVLAETGLLVFIIFCIIQIKIFRCGRNQNDLLPKSISVLGILILPIIGIINSGYLVFPSFFIYFASLIIISKYKYNEAFRRI